MFRYQSLLVGQTHGKLIIAAYIFNALTWSVGRIIEIFPQEKFKRRSPKGYLFLLFTTITE